MTKPIIVPDLAFTTHKGRGGSATKSTGLKELKAKLKYFQFRNDRNGHIPQEEGLERWVDKGLGQHYRDIVKHCEALSSQRLLAWTWMVSPAPDVMALVLEAERAVLVTSLTEEIIEAYYTARGVDVPEYSYVLHDRETNATEDSPGGLQQLHTHVVLPATIPTLEGAREAFDNRSDKGHFKMLREISTQKLEAALDRHIGPDWRQLRTEPTPDVVEPVPALDQSETLSELEQWFGPRSSFDLNI